MDEIESANAICAACFACGAVANEAHFTHTEEKDLLQRNPTRVF